MNKKNIIIGGLIVVLLGVGVVLATSSYQATQADGGRDLGNTVTDVSNEPILGAVTGPSIDGPSWTVGGVATYYVRADFRLGTATPCSIAVPRTGRSMRLDSFAVDMRTATGTAEGWMVSTSTTGNTAMTTLVAKRVLTNADQVLFTSSGISTTTAPASSTQTGIFGTTTTQYINVGLEGAVVLPYTPVRQGSCTAIFVEL